MLVAVWITLVLLALVLVAGSVHVGREGLRTWRAARRLARIVGAGSEILATRTDAAARKAGDAEAAAARLAEATARLQRSLAYAGVVAEAAGDARAAVTRVRGTIPHK